MKMRRAKVKDKESIPDKSKRPNWGKDIPEKRKVRITLQAPKVMEAFLAGEFNGWNTQSLPMLKDQRGVWIAEISLPPGQYEFKVFANKTWMEDIQCKVMIEGISFDMAAEEGRVSNPFGTQNFLFRVK
jgi:1,4-alpha-glucan branching enzyme